MSKWSTFTDRQWEIIAACRRADYDTKLALLFTEASEIEYYRQCREIIEIGKAEFGLELPTNVQGSMVVICNHIGNL